MSIMLEAAHTIGRSYDDRETGIVRAIDIVPMCKKHHMKYDAHELDLLPYLTLDEQARAVWLVGIEAARRRICGRQ